MALVNYSDSESDCDFNQPKTTTIAAASITAASSSSSTKRPFPKLFDRSKPDQIVVTLPSAATQLPEPNLDEPPAKRTRTANKSAFADFTSLLPPPKNRKAANPSTSLGTSSEGRQAAASLKTSAGPAFSRSIINTYNVEDGSGTSGEENSCGPQIAPGQKPPDQVKITGNILMFQPASVSRTLRQTVKKQTPSAGTSLNSEPVATSDVPETEEEKPAVLSRKPLPELDLFSFQDITADSGIDVPQTTSCSTNIAPQLQYPSTLTKSFHEGQTTITNPIPPSQKQEQPQPETLAHLADSLKLSAAERRALFGRGGGNATKGSFASVANSIVTNINMDAEYSANEEMRQSGNAPVQHNPLRAVQPGKHSLKQLVNAVQNQRTALEESFAAGKGKKRETGSKYGW